MHARERDIMERAQNMHYKKITQSLAFFLLGRCAASTKLKTPLRGGAEICV